MKNPDQDIDPLEGEAITAILKHLGHGDPLPDEISGLPWRKHYHLMSQAYRSGARRAYEDRSDAIEAVPGHAAQFAELAEAAPVLAAEIELNDIRVRVEGPDAAPLKLRAMDLLEEIQRQGHAGQLAQYEARIRDHDKVPIDKREELCGDRVDWDPFLRKYVVTGPTGPRSDSISFDAGYWENYTSQSRETSMKKWERGWDAFEEDIGNGSAHRKKDDEPTEA